jgi:hypothetical protein
LDHLDAKVDDVVEIKMKRRKKKRKLARSRSKIIGCGAAMFSPVCVCFYLLLPSSSLLSKN